MAEIRPMSICVVSSSNSYVVFLGAIPNAPGFGFFTTIPYQGMWNVGGKWRMRGFATNKIGMVMDDLMVEHLILPLTDVAEATTEQLNKIDRRCFNISVQPQAPPPPLFQ